MKRSLFITVFLFASLLMVNNSLFSQCESVKKKNLQRLLGPAFYDNSRSSVIQTFDNTYVEQYQINLFKNVVYKLVFDVSNMPEGVIIKVHDIGNKKGPGKYELVFNSETAEKKDEDTYELTLEFPQKKMLISYEVVNNTKPGCVTFVLGYYFKTDTRELVRKKAKVKVK